MISSLTFPLPIDRQKRERMNKLSTQKRRGRWRKRIKLPCPHTHTHTLSLRVCVFSLYLIPNIFGSSFNDLSRPNSLKHFQKYLRHYFCVLHILPHAASWAFTKTSASDGESPPISCVRPLSARLIIIIIIKKCLAAGQVVLELAACYHFIFF